jgi:DNA-binding IclR family transcriptional regulator
VQRDAGTVTLGTRVVALGRAAEARLRDQLVEPARPVIEALARERGETVILSAPCGLEAIVLDVVEAEQPIRLSLTVYGRAPMHLGASGKVLAAYLEDEDRERLLEAVAEPALGAALDAIRRRGWVLTSGELDEGVTAVAAPVLDVRGRLLAAVTLAGPSDRMAVTDVPAAARAVSTAARQVAVVLAASRERDRDRARSAG